MKLLLALFLILPLNKCDDPNKVKSRAVSNFKTCVLIKNTMGSKVPESVVAQEKIEQVPNVKRPSIPKGLVRPKPVDPMLRDMPVIDPTLKDRDEIIAAAYEAGYIRAISLKPPHRRLLPHFDQNTVREVLELLERLRKLSDQREEKQIPMPPQKGRKGRKPLPSPAV